MQYNNRGFISTWDGISSDGYYMFKLMDKSIAFDLTYADVDCSCNGAFYLVSLPCRDSSGNPNQGSCGTWYCDANTVCGCNCPEMDILEGNKYNTITTAHTCDTPVNGHYNSCDGSGCAADQWSSNPNSYGPGKTIDTNNWFTYEVSFISDGNGDLG